jgi:hypothetical protein
MIINVKEKIEEEVAEYLNQAFDIVHNEEEAHYENGLIDSATTFLAQVEIAKMLQIQEKRWR